MDANKVLARRTANRYKNARTEKARQEALAAYEALVARIGYDPMA